MTRNAMTAIAMCDSDRGADPDARLRVLERKRHLDRDVGAHVKRRAARRPSAGEPREPMLLGSDVSCMRKWRAFASILDL